MQYEIMRYEKTAAVSYLEFFIFHSVFFSVGYYWLISQLLHQSVVCAACLACSAEYCTVSYHLHDL